MRILVTYGSKHGGTKGIAEVVGAELREAGHEVDVRVPRGIESLEDWDAVVVGGALYAARWYRKARRFVQRHADELREMPVWFFSSGPLDFSASEETIPATPQVRGLMDTVGARGHATFGGRLASDRSGFIAKAMIRNGKGGDFRRNGEIEDWARGVAGELETVRVAPRAKHAAARRLRWGRSLLATGLLFVGLTALAGGAEMILWPKDNPIGLPLEVLEHTGFGSFLIPGLLLFVFVGLLNTYAGIATIRRTPRSGSWAFIGAGAITVWIVVQMILMQTVGWLHILYLGVGVVLLPLALWHAFRRRAAVRAHILRLAPT